MINKLENLKKLREQINLEVNGLENYPTDKTCMIVANHNCLMDIFCLPMSLPVNVGSVVSSRVAYKADKERLKMVYKYLYPIPLEVNGNEYYSNLSLQASSYLLMNNISLIIFPEGAYRPNKQAIYRGRTGMARILFNSQAQGGPPVSLIPVALDVQGENINCDNYKPTDDKFKVSILNPIDYSREYEQYIKGISKEEKNLALHNIVDKSLQIIAKELKQPYINQYLELHSRRNVMFRNGETVNWEDIQKNYYQNLYKNQFNKQIKVLTKQIKSSSSNNLKYNIN